MRLLALSLVLLLVAPACGRKKAPPPDLPPVVQAPPGPPKITAPPGVPAELARFLDREWPLIAKDGEAFNDKFKEFEVARGNGDRNLMSSLAEEAGRLYESASGRWAGIIYWPDDQRDAGAIDDATHEVCLKFLAEYEKKVNAWTKKSKAIKEFTTAK
jgi:hypothetical protein